MNEGDFVVVGTVRNVHNLLSYGVVGKSVCRMWESCTLAFPCSVNGLFHDGIASYTHFHGACLLVFGFFGSEQYGAGGLSLVFGCLLLYHT